MTDTFQVFACRCPDLVIIYVVRVHVAKELQEFDTLLLFANNSHAP